MGDQDTKSRSRSRQRVPTGEEDKEPTAPSDADRFAAMEKQISVLMTMVSRLQTSERPPSPTPIAQERQPCANPNCAQLHGLPSGQVRLQWEEDDGTRYACCGMTCAQDLLQAGREDDLEAGVTYTERAREPFPTRGAASSPVPSYDPYRRQHSEVQHGAAIGGTYRQPVVAGGHGNWQPTREDVRGMLSKMPEVRKGECLSALGLREELYDLVAYYNGMSISQDAGEILSFIRGIIRHFNAHLDAYFFAGNLMAGPGLSQAEATLAAAQLFGAADQSVLFESETGGDIFQELVKKRIQKAADKLRNGSARSSSADRRTHQRGQGGRGGGQRRQQQRGGGQQRQQQQQPQQQQQQQNQQGAARSGSSAPARGRGGRHNSHSRGRSPPRSASGGGAAQP